MKLSTGISPAHYEMYGDKVYEEIRKVGFESIDYNMPFYDGDLPNLEIYNTNIKEFEDFFKNEKIKIQDSGLVVGQTHSPYHVYHKDDKLFECRIEEIKYSIRATAILGTKYTVIHPAQPCFFDPDDNPERTREINFRMLEKLIPVAEEYDIKIALENMPGEGVPTSTPEMLVDYIDMMDSDRVVACLDTGHANLAKQNIVDFAKKLGSRTKTLHLHDNNGRMDDHYVPFLGLIGCWEEFMKTLKEAGYDGNINLESDTFINRLPNVLRKNAMEISFGAAKLLKEFYDKA